MSTLRSTKHAPYEKVFVITSYSIHYTKLYDNEPVSTKTGIKNGYFSLFEAEDEESGTAVLKAAESYLREIGVSRMVGPYSPTNGEEERALLVEGFDSPPVLYAAYNPEWYKRLFENYGLKKSSDLLAFKIDTHSMPIDKFRKIVGYAKIKS